MCQNKAECKMDGVDEPVCLCPDGFKGPDCSEAIDYCDPNPCLNDADCASVKDKDGNPTFECKCKTGSSGDNW
jgi:hypothetical protein